MARTMLQGEYFGDAVRRRHVLGFAFTQNRFPPDLEIPRHQHALSHLTCIIEGGFRELYDHVELDCPKGSLLIVPSGMAHRDIVGPAGALTLSVEIRPKTLERINDSTSLLSEPLVVGGAQVTHLIERLKCEFQASDDASLLAIASITLELIVKAERMIAQRGPVADWMSDLVEEIHRDPTVDVSLSALAQRFEVHEAAIARSFRRRHGCSIGEYVRWLRLERSRSLLADPNMTVDSVAVQCGFYDQAHFSRAFKAQYGISPRSFRGSSR